MPMWTLVISWLWVTTAITSLTAASGQAPPSFFAPEQVHLALTGRRGEMAVDWVDSCPPGATSHVGGGVTQRAA